MVFIARFFLSVFIFIQYSLFASEYNCPVKKIISLPLVEPQDDSFTCGTNSATRLLKHLNIDVTYQELKKVAPQTLEVLLKPLNSFDIGVGPTPIPLTGFMNEQGDQCLFEYHSNLTLDDILARLCENLPTIPLIVPSLEQTDNFIPALHYIVLTGYDVMNKRLFYVDTNSQTYSIPYEYFLRIWNFEPSYKITRWAFQYFGAVGGVVISPIFYPERNESEFQ